MVQPEPIFIRFSARSPDDTTEAAPAVKATPKSPREEFWARVRAVSPLLINLTTDQLEAKLLREYPGKLKAKLVEHCSQPLKVAGLLREAELMERIEQLVGNSEADDHLRNRVFEDLASLLNQRSHRPTDPAVQAAEEKLAAASSLVFVVRIEKYQSLSLTLLIGSIEGLAGVFDSNPFNLQMFLEAFTAVAFADVFNQQAFDPFASSVTIPESLANALTTSGRARSASGPRDSREAPTDARAIARRQAQAVWRRATTTWLLPVIITLAVAYFAVQELRSISALRERVLAPIIEHQAQLLREDRLRLMPKGDSAR